MIMIPRKKARLINLLSSETILKPCSNCDMSVVRAWSNSFGVRTEETSIGSLISGDYSVLCPSPFVRNLSKTGLSTHLVNRFLSDSLPQAAELGS